MLRHYYTEQRQKANHKEIRQISDAYPGGRFFVAHMDKHAFLYLSDSASFMPERINAIPAARSIAFL